MPHIFIDGQKIEAKQGQTIIEAAYANGLTIPHFCWHPELSVSGNCRMCLIEMGLPKRQKDGTIEKDENGDPIINFFPKLQIACASYISDGMHVKTKSDAALKAQEAVMEFQLINHPLDCPICDEAGQCKLQEYAFKHSNGQSRFIENKNPNPKRTSWGPNVLYDAERCITCSRCIRYAKEKAKQDVLTFVNRGDHVTIQLAEGAEFDNEYSMNVIDICPVGALTSKDFRFASRVWDMSFNDSICPGCSKGCNISLGVRNNEILRIDPRSNHYVNKNWLCDYGRLNQYHFVNENRIKQPLIRRNGKQEPCTLQEAYAFIAEKLKNFKANQIMFLGSALATVEDNHLLAKFAKKVIKSNNVDFVRHTKKSFGDDFLKTADMTPNAKGAIEVGVFPEKDGVSADNLAEKMKYGTINALYAIATDFESDKEILDEVDNLDFLFVHATNKSDLTDKADVVLPAATYAESEGVFVNSEDRAQHFSPAIATKSNLRHMGMKLGRLDNFGAHNDRWNQHELRDCKQNWLLVQGVANQMDGGLPFKNTAEVFDEISHRVVSFKNMDYAKLDEFRGLSLGKGDQPDPVYPEYASHSMKPE